MLTDLRRGAVALVAFTVLVGLAYPLLILGAMGANMMWGSHTYTGEPATDLSSQSRPAPAR